VGFLHSNSQLDSPFHSRLRHVTDRRRAFTLCVPLSIRCLLYTVNSTCSAFIGCGLFSDTEPGECYTRGSNGVYYWTAGQRIDPSRESTFVWRVTSTIPGDETISLMGYTNWEQGQPNYFIKQSCAHLLGGHSFTWNDEFCSLKICSVCELDI